MELGGPELFPVPELAGLKLTQVLLDFTAICIVISTESHSVLIQNCNNAVNVLF